MSRSRIHVCLLLVAAALLLLPGAAPAPDASHVAPLQQLVQHLTATWAVQQQAGSCSGSGENLGDAEATAGASCQGVWRAWQDMMRQLAQQQPRLSGFALLAGTNSLLRRAIVGAGLPAAVLVPDNPALLRYLLRVLSSRGNSNSSSDGMGLLQLLRAAQQQPALTAATILRHLIPAEQPFLLQGSSSSSSSPSPAAATHAAGSSRAPSDDAGDDDDAWLLQQPLLTGSLVLQTALDSYIQVASLPGSISPRFALALWPSARTDSSSSSSSSSDGSPFLLQVGQDEALVGGPILLHATSTTTGSSSSSNSSSSSSNSSDGSDSSSGNSSHGSGNTSSSIMVLHVSDVLNESDEALNSRSPRVLRAAFGLAPEGSRVLLSRAALLAASTPAKQQAAAEAELQLAQQEQLLQQQAMVGALAGSLMTSQALEAWTAVAVRGHAMLSSSSSSSGGSLTEPSAGAAAASSEGCSGAEQLTDWSNVAAAEALAGLCSGTDNSSGCCLPNGGITADATAQGGTFYLIRSRRSNSPRCITAAAQAAAVASDAALEATGRFPGSVSAAFLAGLAPRQLCPALGLAAAANETASDLCSSTSSTGTANATALSGSSLAAAADDDDDDDDDGSAASGEVPTKTRGLKQTAATNTVGSSSNSSRSSSTNMGNSSNKLAAASPATAAAPAAEAAAAAAASFTGSDDEDLAFSPLTRLALLLARRDITPQQLVQGYTRRMERFDPALHTVVTRTDALADAQAQAAQEALQQQAGSSSSSSSRPRLSLLAGLPYGLKDVMAVPGYPTALGVAALRNSTSAGVPSWAFSALSGLFGAVLLAKTATGELAFGDTWFGNITTRNPWHTASGSCGSSAGSAAAVAAGLLPFALGSETWGSVVCPAVTVGVTAFRPTGGVIPTHGMLQVSPSLDKVGVFCRQALDCAVVADALSPGVACSQPPSSSSSSSSSSARQQDDTSDGAIACRRLHLQPPDEAAAFNYSQHFLLQRQAAAAAGSNHTSTASSATPSALNSSSSSSNRTDRLPVQIRRLLPSSFQELPLLSDICIGFLADTPPALLEPLRQLLQAAGGGCLRGPLPPPRGAAAAAKAVLTVLLTSEVAVSFEGLWRAGLVPPGSHWVQLIQLGQVTPAAAFIRAQRLRSLLLQQTRRFFASNGIQVLLKPSRSDVGLDGLPSLLDLPEVLLPVELTVVSSSRDADASSDDGAAGSTGNASNSSGATPLPAAAFEPPAPPALPAGVDGSSQDGESDVDAWLQPDVASILGLPGDDAKVLAVAAAFQSVTRHHLARPPLSDMQRR